MVQGLAGFLRKVEAHSAVKKRWSELTIALGKKHTSGTSTKSELTSREGGDNIELKL